MELQKIDSNIYKIDSGKEGKRIMILGGVHGFERTGIILVEKMIDMFQKDEINLLKGSVILALGNEPAIELNQRWVKPGDDLNRFFSKERLENLSDNSYESNRARKLAEVMKEEADVLIDIHSTNTPSRPFLACENEPEHYGIHKWFNADTVITDPEYILSDGFYSTTDEYMNACGGIGICFETGYGVDTSAVDKVLESVLSILVDQGMIEYNLNIDNITDRDVYRMYARIDLTKEGFRYKKGFGKGDFESVEKGQIIGFHGEKALESPISGIILLQRPEDMWHVGEPVGYLAERMQG